MFNLHRVPTGGAASASSPAAQHALLHALMFAAVTFFASRFAALSSNTCGSDGATAEKHTRARSPTSANALRRTPGEYCRKQPHKPPPPRFKLKEILYPFFHKSKFE